MTAEKTMSECLMNQGKESSLTVEIARGLEIIYKEGVHVGYAAGIQKGIDMAKNDLIQLTMLPCHNYEGIAKRIEHESRHGDRND